MNPKELLNQSFERFRSLYARIGEVVCDALDCFGDDPSEDWELRSDIWDKEH